MKAYFFALLKIIFYNILRVYKNVHLQMNIKGELEYTMRMGTWQFEAGNLILGEVGQQGASLGGVGEIVVK